MMWERLGPFLGPRIDGCGIFQRRSHQYRAVHVALSGRRPSPSDLAQVSQ